MVFDKDRAKEAGKRSGEARRKKARERRPDSNRGPIPTFPTPGDRFDHNSTVKFGGAKDLKDLETQAV